MSQRIKTSRSLLARSAIGFVAAIVLEFCVICDLGADMFLRRAIVFKFLVHYETYLKTWYQGLAVTARSCIESEQQIELNDEFCLHVLAEFSAINRASPGGTGRGELILVGPDEPEPTPTWGILDYTFPGETIPTLIRVTVVSFRAKAIKLRFAQSARYTDGADVPLFRKQSRFEITFLKDPDASTWTGALLHPTVRTSTGDPVLVARVSLLAP